MRARLTAIGVAAAAAIAVLVVFGTGAGDDHKGDYKVRAIFSNAFTVIAGEDVKISGVKVGKIGKLDVTDDNKAAVTLDITEPGFKDFRKDATCTIRPQSLIGERYVECTMTQPRADGDAEPPALQQIKQGDGKGEYLLPDSQTIKPVDIDLVGNIMRLPYRQRLSIIINELGTGLAGNGGALREAVKEANPALEQTDKVLKILADQNETLAQLAKNGDEVLRPLARDKDKVADFIDKANTTAVASAERRSDIEAGLQKLPSFLKELKPTMQRLGGLADQMTPVLTDLGSAAPQINQFIKQLGPFSAAGTPALTSLGDTADVGDQALLKSKPIVTDLRDFATVAKPVVTNLDGLLTSLKTTGGIERLMDFLYFSAASTNGYDSLGHYLRAVFVLTSCTTYSIERTPGCGANFDKPATATTATVKRSSTAKPTLASVNAEIAAGRSPNLARQDAVADGLDPAVFDKEDASKDASSSKSSSKSSGSSSAKTTKINLPASVFPGQPASTPASSPAAPTSTQTSTQAAAAAPTTSTGSGTSTGATTTSTDAGSASSATPSTATAGSTTTPSSGATQTLLDYLLGG
jgi:phospholipid/cholesterol/gamma-HCH transport system substrate-binding protein